VLCGVETHSFAAVKVSAACCVMISASQQADDEDLFDDELAAPGSSIAEVDDQPVLLDKKAGIRDAGLIFVSESKSWLAGMALVVVSGVVLAVTLVTVMVG